MTEREKALEEAGRAMLHTHHITGSGADDGPVRGDWLGARKAMVTALALPTREPESGEGGAALIAAERKRQVAEEGWTPEHDNTHRYGEMAKAAAALAVAGTDARVEDPGEIGDPHDPWGLVRKHRRDRVRQLVIAGALIAAEIDREQRLSPSAQSEPFAVERDDEGRPYPCGAFVADDSRWFCRLESDHAGEHEWVQGERDPEGEPEPVASAPQRLRPPFSVYEDDGGALHIIDATTRVVLTDAFAYDADGGQVPRMEWIAEALTLYLHPPASTAVGDPTNHHNALRCPYCMEDLDALVAERVGGVTEGLKGELLERGVDSWLEHLRREPTPGQNALTAWVRGILTAALDDLTAALATRSPASTAGVTEEAVDAVYRGLSDLPSAQGAPGAFLPAAVCCDYVGMVNFKRALKRILTAALYCQEKV